MTPLGKSATGLWRARKTPQSSFTRQLQMAGHHLGKKLRMIKAPHSAATLGSGRPGDEVHRASNNEAPHGCTQPLGHLLRVAVLEGNYKVPRRTFMYELLATDGMLVKRPIVVTDATVLTGFKEAAWEEALL